jgi:uncharacterized lipoprotein YddW (UPF0748 family)
MKLRKIFVWTFVWLLTAVSLFGTQARAAEARTILIYVNGQLVKSDVPPTIRQSVTLVPLRVIGESLGAQVGWEQKAQTVTIRQQGRTLTLKVGQKFAIVNGQQSPLISSTIVMQKRVMVPLRFVGEQLGLNVRWFPSAQTIKLESKDGAPELRGAWISTVYNLDWPSSKSYGNETAQKEEYVKMLDELQAMGMNAAFVQVRPAADALYPSELVPWSKVLTGKQGQAPSYDPLAFMIEETHRRGMSFHAWFNPFRANTDTKTDMLAENHVVIQHPDWIVKSGSVLYVNPGIPEARQRIIDEIMEVVGRYDIDGVQLDDYFYPAKAEFDDETTFLNDNNDRFASKADWRRDNINQFVKALGESIHAAKPNVQFGISPFGVWRNASVDPTGSPTKAGVTDYDDMFADTRTWIQNGWLDYIAPQIYWSFATTAVPYDKLVDWWANEVRGTGVKLYVGHAPYKLGTTETGWSSAAEIVHQLEYNKDAPEVFGDVFFSAKDLRRNPVGLIPALRQFYGLPMPSGGVPGATP